MPYMHVACMGPVAWVGMHATIASTNTPSFTSSVCDLLQRS